MISVTAFNTLVAAATVMIVYSWVDINHKIYANIVAGIVGSVLFGYLAVIANTGAINAYGEIMQDLSLQIILILVAAVSIIYTAYLIYDAWEELQHREDES